MHHRSSVVANSAPKPWSGSGGTKNWAPVVPSTRGPASNNNTTSSASPRVRFSDDSHSSLATNVSAKEDNIVEKSDTKNLTVVLDSLDDILEGLANHRPARDSVVRTSSAMIKSSPKKSDINDNNNIEDKSKMVDDLTEKLVHALDTNDVVGWKSSEDSPFGSCAKCGISIDGEASVVGKQHYHPNCFICAECKKPLGTAKYFIIGGKNYCEQDKFKFLDECTKCGKIIENEIIRPKDSGKPYHADCFCCMKCSRSLTGKYFNTPDGMLCEDDFADSREKCHRCARPILEATLKALGQAYHPSCFVCSMCPKPLEGIEFFVTDEEKPMCREDYARYIAKTCEECQEKITDETLVGTTTGKYFHRDCYKNRS